MLPVDAPSLSIGLPVHNGEKYIASALRSLLRQSYNSFEIIICDNDSNDETRKICQNFCRIDNRIIYHRNEKNIGAAGNFNKAARLARGRYFAWANHDDLWEPNYFKRCIAALEADEKVVLAYARSTIIDECGLQISHTLSDLRLNDSLPQQRLQRYFDLQASDENVIDGAGAWEGLWVPIYGVIRKPILDQTKLIGPYVSSDTVLLEEILMKGPFVEIEETLFHKRNHKDRSTRASASFEDRKAWFTGSRPSWFFFPGVRKFLERVSAAIRAPNVYRDKVACLALVIRRYMHRPNILRKLVVEILANIRRVLGLKPPREWSER